jgi:hypothetical protein
LKYANHQCCPHLVEEKAFESIALLLVLRDQNNSTNPNQWPENRAPVVPPKNAVAGCQESQKCGKTSAITSLFARMARNQNVEIVRCLWIRCDLFFLQCKICGCSPIPKRTMLAFHYTIAAPLVGQYILSWMLSRTRIITIIIDQKRL